MKTISLALILALTANGLAYSEVPRNDAQQSLTNDTHRVEQAKTEIQKRGVGQKSRVAIRLRDGTEAKGYISQIGETSCQLTDEKTRMVSTITYDTIDRVKGEGASRGKKIAIWTGVCAGAAVIVILLIGYSWHGE
jgi:hypothetical protein